MRVPKKFVPRLRKKQRTILKKLMEEDGSRRVRVRAHAILLSDEGWDLEEIGEIYQVRRQTVSQWINDWEEFEFEGLRDREKSGRPPKLTSSEKNVVKDLLQKYPQAPKIVLAKVAEKTGKQISNSTLKRIAKSYRGRWKRIRKSVRAKRNKKEFRKTKKELERLQLQHDKGEINLVYFDESGFSLHPPVCYAWQIEGEEIEIFTPSKSKRLNVLGFFSKDNQLESFCFEGAVDTRVVVACFNEFAKTIDKKTIVVLDNPPTHTSQEFEDNIATWEKKGLFLKYIPPYSPELNLIEILWRFIKYQWLPFDAYLSFQDLVLHLENILKNVGLLYEISFQ